MLPVRDGHRLAVTTHGPDDAAVTVFLAHCWTLDRHGWHRQVRDLLSEFGHQVRLVTWDHRGHGASGVVRRHEASIDTLGSDWGELVDALAPTGPLVMAGHSIGGMALMALAAQRPELFERVVGVALVSTSSGALDTVTLGLPEVGPLLRAQIPRMLALRSRTLSRRARRRAPIVERLMMRRLVFGTPMRLSDAALAVEGLISCPADTVVGYYEDLMRHDRAHALAALEGVPTRVLVGSRDVLTPPAHARRIVEHLPGARLTVAPGAGHMLPLERDALVSAELAHLVRPHVDAAPFAARSARTSGSGPARSARTSGSGPVRSARTSGGGTARSARTSGGGTALPSGSGSADSASTSGSGPADSASTSGSGSARTSGTGPAPASGSEAAAS